MNCQEIRTAIDTASRRNPLNNTVKAHTSGCPDCRRYADESNALLALLSAQPRVQAPADFDFKLRARIAQAQAQPSGPMAALQSFWTRSFSWTQAAAAATALALVATFTALQFTSHKESITNQNGQAIATNAVSAPQVKLPTVVKPVVAPESQPDRTTSAAANLRSTAVKFNARTMRPTVIAAKSEIEISRPAISVASMVSNDNGQRVYKLDKRQFINAPAGDLIGAQSSLTKPSSVPPSI